MPLKIPLGILRQSSSISHSGSWLISMGLQYAASLGQRPVGEGYVAVALATSRASLVPRALAEIPLLYSARAVQVETIKGRGRTLFSSRDRLLFRY